MSDVVCTEFCLGSHCVAQGGTWSVIPTMFLSFFLSILPPISLIAPLSRLLFSIYQSQSRDVPLLLHLSSYFPHLSFYPSLIFSFNLYQTKSIPRRPFPSPFSQLSLLSLLFPSFSHLLSLPHNAIPMMSFSHFMSPPSTTLFLPQLDMNTPRMTLTLLLSFSLFISPPYLHPVFLLPPHPHSLSFSEPRRGCMSSVLSEQPVPLFLHL